MALKNKIFLAITLTTILGMVSAKAYVVPGGERPEPPRQGGGFPPAPIPQPGGGGYGPGNGGYNGQEQKVIQVRRRIMRENLSLLQLAGIDRRYDGYIVQSITAYVSGSGPRAQMSLIINGQYDASASVGRGAVNLYPRYQAVLGQVRDIQLSIDGGVDLDSVVLTLQQRDGWDHHHGGGDWDRDITVPLSIMRRMQGNDRLDITSYIDMNQFRGMRLSSIEIEANSLYQVAFIDVLINGFTQGQSLQIGNYVQRYSVFVRDAVIGQSAASIVISNRGDLDIRSVTLRLSRR